MVALLDWEQGCLEAKPAPFSNEALSPRRERTEHDQAREGGAPVFSKKPAQPVTVASDCNLLRYLRGEKKQAEDAGGGRAGEASAEQHYKLLL